MDLLVAADDRTGALETAAALADHGAGPVAVRVWPATLRDEEQGGVAVIDLGTRALSADEARRRAAGLPFDRPSAHKIDSTLRGNWAEELVARHEATGVPVLLVPALPELGRTCVGGVVLVHGEPVHEVVPGHAAGRHAGSSRPAELLAAAGATEVVELEHLDAATAWLAKPSGIAVADAADADTVQSLATAWAGSPGTLLAGTSTAIGCAADALDASAETGRPPALSGAVLIACGSLHPVARQQVAVAERRGVMVTDVADELAMARLRAGEPVVLVTELPGGDVTEPMAVAAASSLARGVAELCAGTALAALVLIGGDTAAAVLGDAEVIVHGSLAPGTSWGTVEGIAAPVIARSGGFGAEHALLELVGGTPR